MSQPPFCFVCGMKSGEVFQPSNYPFPLCHLCDRMPRGQVLMAAQLFELKIMIGSFLEKAEAREH